MRTIGGLISANAGQQVADKILGQMLPKVDYATYGGALLLGINGIVTICHGRSTAPAISNAIKVAHRAVGAQVNDHIVAMAREASAAS